MPLSFASAVNVYITGRAGAGKTSLANLFLSSSQPVMPVSDRMDCTDSIGFLKLENNLRFFDLPPVNSIEVIENITRVALLMPQIEDKFSYPVATPMNLSDEFTVTDFSKYISLNQKPEEEFVTVEQWQSPEIQEDVAPDVIIYVHTPHMTFLSPDRKYLRELLKTWKNRKNRCLVITVLNIIRQEGKILPTPQQIEDSRTDISQVYQAIHPTEYVPPIVEIDCRTGEGIDGLTEIIHQILPPEKIQQQRSKY